MKNIIEDEEENNRADYPAERLVIDIMELLQDMRVAGFAFVTYFRSHCLGEPMITVDLWEADNDLNTFGNPLADIEGDKSIYPIISGTRTGRASYSGTDTKPLHDLYDLLFSEYRKRVPAPYTLNI